MDRLKIERIGGLAGFGGAHLKSRGTVDLDALSPADQAAVRRLLDDGGAAAPAGAADGFVYRITHETDAGSRTIEAADHAVPAALAACVRDTLE